MRRIQQFHQYNRLLQLLHLMKCFYNDHLLDFPYNLQHAKLLLPFLIERKY